jgi:AraC-like DNA-binding protein
MSPAIEIRSLAKGSLLSVLPCANEIVYILTGTIILVSERGQDFIVPEGHLFFLPKGKKVTVYPQSRDAEALIIRFYDKMQFCHFYRIEDLLQQADEQGWVEKSHCLPEYFILEANRVLNSCLEILALCHRKGLRCTQYNENKIKELFQILLAFYKEETLYCFFYRVVSADFDFSQQVLDKYSLYGNVSELATTMNYTVSGFEKKFRRVFGESPYRWMKRKKAQEIRGLICGGTMNLKEIGQQFGFSSMSDFYSFVRRELGQTAGEIRMSGKQYSVVPENEFN